MCLYYQYDLTKIHIIMSLIGNTAETERDWCIYDYLPYVADKNQSRFRRPRNSVLCQDSLRLSPGCSLPNTTLILRL